MTSSLNEGGTAVFALRDVSLSFEFGGVYEDISRETKVSSWGERFDIKDDRGVVNYQVEGSFFQIPKTFTIYDAYGEQVSEISKEFFTLLPRFTIQLRNGSNFVIRKKLTFWRDKYEFDNLGLRIEGNIWDLNFKLLDDRDQVIAEIRKEIFHLTSTYTVTVYEDSYADLVISLCVAIDYVEMLESQSN